MKNKEIKPDIYYVGVKDHNKPLFDQLIPLPDGTSYNSYLIKGSEKVAIIDTAYPPKQLELLKNIQELKVNKIDYIISNHAEQDHSGAIPALLEEFPDAMVVTNPKCKEFLQDLLNIEDAKFLVVKDGETLSLGNKTLEFIFAPWVHWPDTMFTYLQEDNILFSCDFFGAHTASDELYVMNEDKIYSAARRYYAEIMMPFRAIFKKYLDKIDAMNVDMIAPSHGPIYQNPSFIINAYKDWASNDVANRVVMVYVSMYESTKKMVDHLAVTLIKQGITVDIYNAVEMDLGELAMDIVDAATVIIATPTVLFGPHPAIIEPVNIVNILKPKCKYFSIISSYGWGGTTFEQVKGMLGNLKAELLTPVNVKGNPKQADFELIDALAEEIIEKHSSLNILQPDSSRLENSIK